MKSRQEDRLWHAAVKSGALTVFRALRSTAVIGAVALLLVGLRDGGFQWAKMKKMAAANRTLFVMIFLGILVWDYWFQRVKRQRSIEQHDVD